MAVSFGTLAVQMKSSTVNTVTCPSYRLLPAPVKLKVPVLEPRMEILQTETYGLLSAALAEFHLQQL